MCTDCEADRSTGGDCTTRARPVLDLRVDGHVHTGFANGGDGIGVLALAAERAGLTRLTLADRVGPETTWLRAYLDSIRRAQRRTDVRLRVGIEVEIVRGDGWVDFPSDLAELEIVSVGLARLPLGGEPATVAQARDRLRMGELSVANVVEIAVTSTARAMERTSRYAPTQLARPLSLLAALGVEPEQVPDSALAYLVAACRATNVAVEVSEAWRSPASWLLRPLASSGVALVPASDTANASLVGQWRYVRSASEALAAAPAGPPET